MANKKFKLKRGDTVIVIAGKDKGKTGRILKVLPESDRVLVEGVAMVKRHQKPVGEQPGQILTKEAAVHISNVALYNVEESRRVKVGYRVADGKKVRFDKKTGASITA